MIRGKMIGRLMHYYFEDASPFKETFKNLTDINPE
jgi:hypothetical protein